MHFHSHNRASLLISSPSSPIYDSDSDSNAYAHYELLYMPDILSNSDLDGAGLLDPFG